MKPVLILTLVLALLASVPSLAAPASTGVTDPAEQAPLPSPGTVPNKEDEALQSSIKDATQEALKQVRELVRELR